MTIAVKRDASPFSKILYLFYEWYFVDEIPTHRMQQMGTQTHSDMSVTSQISLSRFLKIPVLGRNPSFWKKPGFVVQKLRFLLGQKTGI